MVFESRKSVDQNDVEEADTDHIDLSNADDEHNSADDASDEEDDESAEDGPAKGAKSLLDEVGKMNWSFHCLAFALSPKYYDQEYLATPAPGGGQRKAPNEDSEVMQGVIEAFSRTAEDKKDYATLREEFNKFIMKKGLYELQPVQADAATMNAIDWWFNYGSETPNLNEVAKRVLSQPISSSSAERNWSTYSFIHNVKRNKLNTKTADKLVFIHANERLKRRFSEGYNSGPHYKWDVEPDNSLLEDSRLKLEQLHWASLEDVAAEPPQKKRRTENTRK
ncbi:hypothetical protein ACQ4PT_007893 [Festuca glaucescens]